MSKQALLQKKTYDFNDLVEVVEILRAPGGCPWDIEQTHQSIRKGLIEETYEVIEGIDKNDPAIMKEELGDLLLQVVFHASIANSNGTFDMDGVCTDICTKLIYRHPHVFGDVTAETSDVVLKNWDELKKKEKGQKSKAEVMQSVSSALPSLMRAQKLIKKSECKNSIDDAVKNIQTLALSIKDGGDKDAVSQILFECARLGNIFDRDLEQDLYVINDEFCKNTCKNL